jgi:protein-L-isoaspartate(D-aspartate) O-methyltransferase
VINAAGKGSRQGGLWVPRPPNLLSPLRVILLVLGLAAAAGFVGSQDDATFARRRQEMVSSQVAARGVRDPRVLRALADVPRHLFVLPAYIDQAYEDHPLPIAEGQTISQPYIVALMTECLDLKIGDKVLEIGTGSGYQAAVLGRIVDRVFTVEIHEGLARLAAKTLERLGFRNVRVRSGDGFFGWPEEAPFDGIIVTCAVPEVPPALFAQLAEGGRLVIPLGDTLTYQRLTVITKKAGEPSVQQVLDVRFVPMTGEALKKK